MTTERFSKQEFEAALPTNKITGNALWYEYSFDKGEYVYRIDLKNEYTLEIRSSVGKDGYAKESGEDSIRLYILDTRNNTGVGKSTRTHRTPGWAERLNQKVRELYKKGMIMQRTVCKKCGAEMVLRKGKYGEFYGCTNYPSCKNTMRVTEKKQLERVANATTREYKDKKAIHQTVKENVNQLLADIPQHIIPQNTFEPSEYQQVIFEFVQNGTGNAVVEAVAGSGKSTTIIKALEFTPTNASVGFLAFNKKIADELKKRAPSHVHVSTLHSLGFSNIRNVYGNKIKVEPSKIRWIIKDEIENMSKYYREIIETNISSVIKLVSLLKATLLKPTNENMEIVCDNYNIETNGDWQQIYQMAKTAYEKSIQQTWRIDYDDMIFWCATGKVECEKFDLLFVDEAQDLNSAQVEMVLTSIHGKSRVVCVGDRNQSIYGFRGADTQAIPYLIKKLNAVSLPLSICYRCPKSHVELAQELVPQIQTSDFAKDGIIDTIEEKELTSRVKAGDLVICRTNAPLVRPAFELIRNGIKAVILGRDIGKGLLNTISRAEKRNSIGNISQLITALYEYKIAETKKLLAQNKENKAQHLEDTVETIFALSDGCNTIEELKERILTVFSDTIDGVTFSSIHKVKGAEADRVFILHPELIPHPMALKSQNQESIQQEYNIKYVALTRSKSELYFVV